MPASRRPSARRAHARAVSASTGTAASSPRSISSGGGASKRTRWQRETIVGSTSCTRSVSSTTCTKRGGSSSVFSSRLAAWSFIVSADSITNTRRLDSNGVRVAAATTGSSMSATSISAAPDGRTHVRSGCASRATRSATVSGSAAPSASSAAANARAVAALPAPAGPWNRYACEGGIAPASAGPSTAARVRVGLERRDALDLRCPHRAHPRAASERGRYR